MKFLLILILLLGAVSLTAQTTFVVDDFSDQYFARVFISDPSEVFSKGWIAIFDKKAKRQLLKINSEELTFDLHDGALKSNVKELPYGEQSLIMYEDYNFDGKKDLAVMDGQNSCYHGPSFQIFLATKLGFIRSPSFTRLAQEYCGMFQVVPETKTIHTMTKSGCCWHQFSEFAVRNNKPIETKVFEEGASTNGLTWDFVEYNRVGSKLIKKDYSVFDAQRQEHNVVFSFKFSNQKTLRLVELGDTLNYIFTDKDNKVELMYSGRFYASEKENAVWFSIGKTLYKILPDGINVISHKKEVEMKAMEGSLSGELSKVHNTQFYNVTNQSL